MSWPSSFALTLLLPLLLAGCGFKPLYSRYTEPASSKLFAGVKVDPVSSTDRRLGQLLQHGLEDQLNPGGVVPGNAAYRLHVQLTSWSTPIGTARDGTVSRYNIYLDSVYELYRTSDDKLVTSGSLRHVSSYNNITNAYFSTYVSEGDATAQGIAELGELYRSRLATYLEEGAPVQDKKTDTQKPVFVPINPWQPEPNIIQPITPP